MAFDAAGDLFYGMMNANLIPDAIFECSASCLSDAGSPIMVFQEPQSLTTTQLNVGSLAVDPWGNLFFTDSALNSVGSSESVFSNLKELPVSAGTGYAGVTTGFTAAPTILYTLTPSYPSNYDDEVDGVAVDPRGTVYFATQYDGVFAFPNNGGTLTAASVASSMYSISTQGSELLALDAQGNAYVASYGTLFNMSGADNVGKITVNNLIVPSTHVGNVVTNSATLNPVTTLLNDGNCNTPQTVNFAAAEGGTPTTEFSAAVTGSCASTLSGGSAFPTTITYTPAAGGIRSAILTSSDSDGNNGTATVSGVAQVWIPQTINFTAPTSPVIYGVSSIPLIATGGASRNPVIFSVVSGPGTINGSTVTVTGVGTIVIEADQAGNAVYTAAPPVQQSISVNQASQSINFIAPISPVTYGVGPIQLNATGGASGNPVIFSVASGPGNIYGNMLYVYGAGTILINADQAGNADYAAAATVQQSIVVNQIAQTIVFTPPTSPVTYGVGSVPLSASGGASGNPIVFSVVSGPGSINGNMVNVNGVGTIVIDADQAGNTDYTAAATVQQSIVVNPATPLTLPGTSAAALPQGIINQSYNTNGSIYATGGSGTGYVFTVNGNTVPTDNTPLPLADGLSAYNSGSTLSISGTPTAAATLTLNVTVTDSINETTSQTYSITVINPAAGYTVTGSVIYTGVQTGWIYLHLVGNGGNNLGTAIPAKGSFIIHGVPPGVYTLYAYMDPFGYGSQNASDPMGASSMNAVVVTSANVNNIPVMMVDPSTPTLGTATPTWDPSNGFGVFSGGAVISYDPITDNTGLELPTNYIVQWSLDNSFNPAAGSQCFPATGAQQPWIISGFSGSGPYYFRAAGVVGSCTTGTIGNYSAATSSPYTIADPSSGNLVHGTVSFSQTATGPLYVGFYDQNTGNVYATVVGSTANPPASGVGYSLYVPTGSNYYNFAVVDQKNQGLMIPGTIGNVNEQLSQATIITSGTNSLGNLALPW